MKDNLAIVKRLVAVLIAVAAILLAIAAVPQCAKAQPHYGIGDEGEEWHLDSAFAYEDMYLCAILMSRLDGNTTSTSYVRVAAKDYGDRMHTCMMIADEADLQGVDKTFALAIAWEESKFKKSAVSKAGAVGPLQVLPRYWCPNGRQRGCDLVEAGIGAIKKLTGKYDLSKAACHYNSGNKCNRSSRAYATRVLVMRERLEVFRRWTGC